MQQNSEANLWGWAGASERLLLSLPGKKRLILYRSLTLVNKKRVSRPLQQECKLVDNINDIHPQMKKEVGLRFANLALADTYKKIWVRIKVQFIKAWT